ncbi:hypothetical protein HDU67_003524 [Dinochytrium kinnereticum]|nr:hypothetical protein HDU67_003524 [Dinochytrium kinnereticum]
MPKAVLIVGASRGLGRALALHLASLPSHTVFITSRTQSDLGHAITEISGIDITDPNAGIRISEALPPSLTFDEVFMVPGYFSVEGFETLNWGEQKKMFDVCAIGPLFVIQALVLAGKIREGSKVILITSEGGSITLRALEEGGGNYAVEPEEAIEPLLNCVRDLTLETTGRFMAPLGAKGVGNAHLIGDVF